MIKFFCSIVSLCLFFNLTTLSIAQVQPWFKLISPVNTTLRQLSFVDSLTGWAAGDLGTIIRTTNGGRNWEIQNSTIQSFILDIFFLNKNLGWALSIKDDFPFNPIILKTTNGGDLWIAENFPDSLQLLRTIFFVDSLNGFVGGSYIGYTTDGGNGWNAAVIDSNMVSDFPIYNFSFYNKYFGYACGGRVDVAGVIWQTTNSGMNWIAKGVGSDEVFDLFILDSLNAITLSGDPEGFYPVSRVTSSNAGKTWNYDTLSFFGISFAIDFRTYNEGWSASGYKFILTTDRGATWREFETPESSTIYDLQFTDPRNGYAVGLNGVVLKFNPTLAEIKTEPEFKNDFFLFQNYPNPFNPSTSIKFSLEKTDFVTLTIYDYLGNEITTLINEEKARGSYEIQFDPKLFQLASGIYFYRLKTGINAQTRKMVYLK